MAALLLFAWGPVWGAAEGPLQVTIDGTRSRTLRLEQMKVSGLERLRYFRLYNWPGTEWAGAGESRSAEFRQWLHQNGVAPGRGILWQGPAALTEDPERPGMIDPKALEKVFARVDPWFAYAREKWPGAFFAGTQGITAPWLLDDKKEPIQNLATYKALADATARWLEYLKQKNFPAPEWMTIWNEPSYNWAGGELGKATRILADAVKERGLDTRVGGPTTAWPYPFNGDWGRWERNEKAYIDACGDVAQFYDFHFYSSAGWATAPGTKAFPSPNSYASQYEGNTGSWEQGKLEAFLDLVQAYHLSVWGGQPRPIVCTETGNQGLHPQFGPWENDFKPFLFMTTTVNHWMRFVDRPEVALVVPFILDGGAQSARGMAVVNSNHGGFTRFKDFYEFLAPVSGLRLPVSMGPGSTGDERDLLIRATLSGSNLYVWAQNRRYPLDKSMTLALKTVLPNGKDGRPIPVGDARVRRLRWEGPIPEPHSAPQREIPGRLQIDTAWRPLASPDKLEIGGLETVLVCLPLHDAPRLSKTRNEETFYGDRTSLPLQDGREVSVNISLPPRKNLEPTAYVGLGLFAGSGFKKAPKVKVNGHLLPDWDLSWTRGIASFHAVEMRPVPQAWLREGENLVSVALAEGEGTTGKPRLVSVKCTLAWESGVDEDPSPFVRLAQKGPSNTGTGPREPLTETVPDARQRTLLIDRGMPGYREVGRWEETKSPAGQGGSPTVFTRFDGEAIIYHPGIQKKGPVRIRYYRIPCTDYRETKVEYRIEHGGNVDSVVADLTGGQAGWEDLGTFDFDGRGGEHVRLVKIADFMAGAVTRADAVQFEQLGE